MVYRIILFHSIRPQMILAGLLTTSLQPWQSLAVPRSGYNVMSLPANLFGVEHTNKGTPRIAWQIFESEKQPKSRCIVILGVGGCCVLDPYRPPLPPPPRAGLPIAVRQAQRFHHHRYLLFVVPQLVALRNTECFPKGAWSFPQPVLFIKRTIFLYIVLL